MADDDIIRGGLDIVTDKKKNKPKAEQETAQPTAAQFNNKAGSDHDIARELKIYRRSTMAYRIAKEISEQLQQVQQQCSIEIEQVQQAE